MSRVLVLAVPLAWFGVALVLSGTKSCQRPSLHERLSPHIPGGNAGRSSRGGSVRSMRELGMPIAQHVGGRLSRLLGIQEDLGLRLRRAHSPESPATFRSRQAALAGGGLALGVAVVGAVRPPPLLALACVLGSPLVVFLALEQQVAAASARWQRHLELELPVVAEQLGMLLSAGYSLGAAINRLSERGSGASSADLARVCDRIRQGVPEIDALREWSTLARLDGLDRLVAVLALNRQATDLGGLVAEAARQCRRDLHRDLLETIERRAQQVWIPVTVATLIPGVIFLAVPFVHAMRFFATG